MKKLLFIALGLFSIASFANSSLENIASASPTRVCYVDLIDAFSSYRYETFHSYSYNGNCRDALRDCNRAKHRRGLRNAVCRSRNSGPSYPNPVPAPTPGPRYGHLLNMSDYDLAEYALRGRVGSCEVTTSYSGYCNYYVKVNGRGYPQGTGCAQREYASRYGCYSLSEKENAGCLVRMAIKQRACR